VRLGEVAGKMIDKQKNRNINNLPNDPFEKGNPAHQLRGSNHLVIGRISKLLQNTVEMNTAIRSIQASSEDRFAIP
jgi:hypothetical protein